MKKLILIVVLLNFISCNKENENKNKTTPNKITGYHIYGEIPSFNNKEILLQKKELNKEYTTLQKTKIKNNHFEFKGNNSNTELIYLGFKDFNYKIPILINNFETLVKINPTDLDKTVIIGSKLQKEYTKYLEGLKKAKNKFVYKTKWINKNNSSPIATIILSEMLGTNKWRLEQNKKAFDRLSVDNKNSKLGLAVKSFIQKYFPKVEKEHPVAEFSLNPEIDNKTPIKTIAVKTPEKPKKNLPKRRKSPNFSAESLNGKDLSLNEVRKNATITLIDFWASWCAPCRAENPHLVKLYKKYHKSGFQIIGVSEDNIDKKQLWKNAIKQDGLSWHHVIDDDARVATMFGVKSIPHTVLLDENGGIIFVKKTSYTIEKKLKEVFGY